MQASVSFSHSNQECEEVVLFTVILDLNQSYLHKEQHIPLPLFLLHLSHAYLYHYLYPYVVFSDSLFKAVEDITSSSEEMEMYAAVNRKFRHLFTRQEHMKTFKTYDKVEVRRLYSNDNC